MDSIELTRGGDRKRSAVMYPDAVFRQLFALLFCACAANAHFNLFMNETETWRLLGNYQKIYECTITLGLYSAVCRRSLCIDIDY